MKKISIFAFLLIASSPAMAQNTPSATSLQYAQQIAKACINQWEAQTCLGAVADSNMVLLSNYGADLQSRKMEAEAEALKQHCAATTAASRQQVPAYAMKSALTECANTITDLAARTGVQPDPSHFQLLIAPLLCLGGDPACAALSDQLAAYIR
ncbi:MAG: hypothetical protein HYU57_06115 [Micavibrio aeruginosavorus]|nr:hypothetical protein [Micavibrio aeruginosavorus]